MSFLRMPARAVAPVNRNTSPFVRAARGVNRHMGRLSATDSYAGARSRITQGAGWSFGVRRFVVATFIGVAGLLSGCSDKPDWRCKQNAEYSSWEKADACANYLSTPQTKCYVGTAWSSYIKAQVRCGAPSPFEGRGGI